jgi:hypothetical protein
LKIFFSWVPPEDGQINRHMRPQFGQAVGWLASGANPNVFAPPLGGAFFADQGFDEHGWADRVRKLNEEKRKDNPVVAAGL